MKLRNLLILVPLLLSACAHHVAPTSAANQQAAAGGGQTYTVQKGDYLHAIAKKLNVDQNQIVELNHLSPPYTIFPGQILQVAPGAGMAVAATAPAEPDEPVESAATPVQRTVESAPLAPISAQKPAEIDRSSPTALAPPTQLTPQPAAPAEAPAPSAADEGTGPSLVWPVKGDIVSSFGPKPGGLHNDGINIAAAEGTPVKAAAAGTVAYAGDELKGFGNLVLVRHDNGWVTAYAHMGQIGVKKGDAVKSGQQIGTVGQTGSIDSPQLHFELRHGKDAVDPTAKLGA